MMKSKTDINFCTGSHVEIIKTISIKAAIVCMFLYSIIPLYYAQANLLCGTWDTLNVMGGEYRIHNNIWGSNPGTQCITAYPDSTYFCVTTSTHNSTTVEAYPFILRGRHFGSTNTTNSGMPILVSNIETAPFIWSVDPNGATTTGKWNIAFEAWFSTTPARNPPDGSEIMIWLRWRGMVPAGSKVASAVPIGGYNWDVYHLSPVPWGSWLHYIVYRITNPVNYVNLDLKDFIDDSLARGYLQNAWYLDNMEAGFELVQSGQGLTSKSFAALVNDSFSVDFIDFAIFANQWLRDDCTGANAWCGGADYPPEDGKVNLEDLEEFVNYWLAE